MVAARVRRSGPRTREMAYVLMCGNTCARVVYPWYHGATMTTVRLRSCHRHFTAFSSWIIKSRLVCQSFAKREQANNRHRVVITNATVFTIRARQDTMRIGDAHRDGTKALALFHHCVLARERNWVRRANTRSDCFAGCQERCRDFSTLKLTRQHEYCISWKWRCVTFRFEVLCQAKLELF